MSTTTIRLTDELKTRVARAAAEAGTTAHNFILEAISDKADLVEQRAGFHAQAQERFEELSRSGKTLAWSEMRSYLQERAEGLAPVRPRARKLQAPAATGPVPVTRGSARRKA